MLIYIICDYYIGLHKTNTEDLWIELLKKWNFQGKYQNNLLPLESGNLQLEQTKFPVFWQNFQILCVFPDRDFFVAIFPVFPVQWVP